MLEVVLWSLEVVMASDMGDVRCCREDFRYRSFSCDEDGKDQQASKKSMDREGRRALRVPEGLRRQAVDPTGTRQGRELHSTRTPRTFTLVTPALRPAGSP